MDGDVQKVKVVFAGRFVEYFKPHLTEIIRSLGGETIDSDIYTSEATHCIIDTARECRPSSFVVIGFVLAGKPVLRADYIMDSRKSKRFLDSRSFLKYTPTYLLSIVEHVQERGGKMFYGQSVSVMLNAEESKKTQIKKILEDAGAKTVELTPQLLTGLEVSTLLKVNMILTEPIDSWPPEHQLEIRAFLSNRHKGNWPIQFLSYYYLQGLLIDPKGSQAQDKFDLSIVNSASTDFHKKRNAASQHFGDRSASKRFRPGANATDQDDSVITISDDDDDDDVKEVGRDDVVVTSVKGASGRNRVLRTHKDTVKPVVIVDLVEEDNQDEIEVIQIRMEGEEIERRSITSSDSGSDEETRTGGTPESSRDPTESKQHEPVCETPAPDEKKAGTTSHEAAANVEVTNNVSEAMEFVNDEVESNASEAMESVNDDDPESEGAKCEIKMDVEAIVHQDSQLSLPESSSSVSVPIGDSQIPDSESQIRAGNESSEAVMDAVEGEGQQREPSPVAKSSEPVKPSPVAKPVESAKPSPVAKSSEPAKTPPAIEMNLENPGRVREVLSRLLRKQHDSNQGIEIDGTVGRTVRFSRDKAARRSKFTKTQLPDLETYAKFDVWDNSISEAEEERTTDGMLALHEFKSFVDSTQYPQARTMYKIMTKYLLESPDVDVVISAHELLIDLLFLHLPTTRKTRTLHASFLCESFTPNSSSDDAELCREFFNFLHSQFKDLLEAESGSLAAMKADMLVSYMTTLLQRDMEYWWKHGSVRAAEGPPLVRYLFGKDGNIERRMRCLLELFPAEVLRRGGAVIRYLWKTVAIVGMWCAAIDRDTNASPLSREDSQKRRLSRVLVSQLEPLRKSNPELLRHQLLFIRPAWLALLVAAKLASPATKVHNLDSLMASLQSEESAALRSLVIDKFFATFQLHKVEQMLLKPDRKKASSAEKTSASEDSNEMVRYDSKVAVDFEQIMKNLATMNRLRKEASAQNELCDKFVMLKFSV